MASSPMAIPVSARRPFRSHKLSFPVHEDHKGLAPGEQSEFLKSYSVRPKTPPPLPLVRKTPS
jgi:hypothetical protein